MVLRHFFHENMTLFSYTIGFGYSLIAGLLIKKTHELLYKRFLKDNSIGWRSTFTGLVERGLYTGAFLLGHLEFIGVWLTLKSVAHWERYYLEFKKRDVNIEGTIYFNNYFIGTGLSIAYGLIGGFIAEKLIHYRFISAIGVGLGLFAAHKILNSFIQKEVEKEMKSPRSL